MAKLNSTYENSWQRVSDSLTRVEALMKQLYFLKFGEEWDEVQAAELKSRSDVERDTQDEDLRLGSVISLTSKSEEDEQEEINIGAVILEPEAEVTEASVDLRSEHLNDEQFGSYEVSDVHVSPCDMEVNDRRYSKVFNAGTTNLEMGTECVEDEVIIDCSNVEATQADDEQEEVKTVAMIQSNANWKILLESVGSTDVNVLAVPIEIDAKFGCVYDAHEVLDEWYDRDTITNSTKVTEMDWGNKKIKIMGESFGFEEIWFLVGALTCEINAATVSTCSKTKIYGSPNLLSTAPKTYKHEDSSLAWMALSVLDVFILDKEKENFSIARFKSFPFDPGGCWYSNLYWTDVSYTELNLEDKVVFEDWDISTGAFIESFAMAKLNSTYENSWQRVSDSLTRVEALMKQLYFLKFGEEWDEVQAAELKSRSDVERDTQDEDLRLGSVISLTSKSEEDEQEEINIGAVILEPEAEVTEASVDLRSEHLNDEQFGSYEVSDVHVSPCDMEVNDRRYSKVFNAGTTNLEMGTECVEDEVIIDCSNVEATQADDEQEEVKTVAMIQSNANWKILLESVGSTDVNVLAVPIEIDAKFGCVYDAHEVLDEWYDRDTITNSTKVTEMDWGNKKIKIMGESFGFEEIWFLVGALTCEINAATVSTCSKTKIYGSPNLLSTAPKTYKHEDSSLAWMALSVLDVFILDKEKENFSIARFKSFPFDPGGCWYSNLYWTDVSYTELNLEDKVVFEDWDISTGAFIESFAMAKLNSTYENSWQRVSDSLTRVEALMKQLYFLKFGEEWDEVQAAELKSRSDVERDTQDEDLRLGSVISLTSKSEEDEQEEINIGAVILEPEAEVTEASVDLRSEHLNDEQFGSYEVSDVHVSPCDMEVNDRRYSKVFNAGTTNLEMGTECVEDEVIIDCSNVEATQADDEQEEVKTVAMIQSNANWKILLESVGSTDVNVLAVPIEIDAKFGCVYDAHEVLDEWYDRDTITNSTKVTEMDWGNKKIKIMGESFGFEEIWFLVGALTCEINAATVSTCSKTKIYGSPNLLSTAPKTYKHEDSSLAWMALSVLDVFILDKEKENFSIARFKSFPFDPGGCWYSNLYWTDVSYTELNLEDKIQYSRNMVSDSWKSALSEALKSLRSVRPPAFTVKKALKRSKPGDKSFELISPIHDRSLSDELPEEPQLRAKRSTGVYG
ncbi:uncharacterized protein G2W53_027844 [Senna tora]|uniref:Uncharacterized protein n=1 Tax=Senna tora TaxID=362788 RepID=A0A834TRC2_9FABA|nr:uncharacterized protein G2W53_027844 [Senna tora]